MNLPRPIRVLHASSILQTYPLLLPTPPITSCAPCWNIYRLHETLVNIAPDRIQATIYSACEKSQLPSLKTIPQQAHYEHAAFSRAEIALNHIICEPGRFTPYMESLMRRIFKTDNWLNYRFGWVLWQHWQAQPFDLFVLDDGPQNINFISTFVPREKLVFYMRGQMGMSRRDLPKVGALLVTNAPLADYAREIMPTIKHAPPIYVVSNSIGVEFANVDDLPQPPPHEKRTIIFVGRFVADKGVRELVQAFKLVQTRHPEMHLRIVGGTKLSVDESLSAYQKEVMALAETLPPESISFAGFVPYQQVPHEYLAAQMAVFPSVWVEGFGMAALEAMRCGLPIIASDRPGFRSYVDHEKNGLIVNDPQNIEELADAICRLIEDEPLAQALAERGKATALAYTPEKVAQDFLDFAADFV